MVIIMKIAIIGAGASGLFLANLLEQNNIKYTIFDDGKIGRKILASGNGRCNISNLNLDKKYYHNNRLASILINKHKERLFNEFNRLNIYTKADNEGRLYPLSESSLSVLNALTKNIKLNVVNLHVNKISKKNNKYYLNDYNEAFDYVAIGIGSPSSYKQMLDYSILESLDLKFNKFKPSLTGFKLKENVKAISGVRAKATVSLLENNKLVHKEDGEIIFKDDGISGICIMNLSSYYNYTKEKNIKLIVSLVDKKYDSYITVLNPKLLDYVNKNNLDPMRLEFNIKSTYDFEFSQVSNGGIDLSSLNDNLSLKSDNHIFFMGEVIDCDGLCGGFNLSFAFLSAIEVSEVLINEISNK